MASTPGTELASGTRLGEGWASDDGIDGVVIGTDEVLVSAGLIVAVGVAVGVTMAVGAGVGVTAGSEASTLGV